MQPLIAWPMLGDRVSHSIMACDLLLQLPYKQWKKLQYYNNYTCAEGAKYTKMLDVMTPPPIKTLEKSDPPPINTLKNNVKNMFIFHLGSYHFLPGGGGRLSVIAGRQFFLVPPFAYVKKFWSPPFASGAKFWSPPLASCKNFGPPPKVKEHPSHTTSGKGSD